MTSDFKAVFFDLDGTLRITTPSPTDAFIHIARSLDVEINTVAERRVKIWAHRYWGQDDLVKQDMTRFDTDEFWVNYSKLLLETVDATKDLTQRAQVVRDWFGTEYDPHVELAAGSRQMLAALKESGYILGLISNRSTPLHNVVDELALNGLFDLLLAAGEVGAWKPNPAIFTHAIAQFERLQAKECIYVGDNYYADGHGAEAAGLTPVIFDPENLYENSSYWRIQRMEELISQLSLHRDRWQ